jgi:hypothetical protein
MAMLAAGAGWVVLSGGRTLWFFDVAVPMHQPQNALTGVWICAVVFALSWWRPTLTHAPLPREARRIAAVVTGVAGLFAIGAAPLLWQALQLIVRGEYVSQEYGWRSVPRGVDLLAPLLGHPLHPLMAAVSRPVYAALGQNAVEAVGWLGIVPIVLLVVTRRAHRNGIDAEAVTWRIVAIGFAIFALGPFLTIGGFDTGLKLPELALRYVPLAANARMPGRAIAGVYLALGVLVAMSLQRSTGRLRSPAVQWLLILLVAFEYWDAPIRLTPLDRPGVYGVLAAAPSGAVCEVPFGIGDGLSVGVGSQARIILYYATLHEHPLAGPTTDQRRLRAIGGPVAAAGTDERCYRVRRAGAGKALFAFLEPAPQTVGAEPFLCFDADGMMILTHEGLLDVAAGVLRRRDLRRHAVCGGLGWRRPAQALTAFTSRATRTSIRCWPRSRASSPARVGCRRETATDIGHQHRAGTASALRRLLDEVTGLSEIVGCHPVEQHAVGDLTRELGHLRSEGTHDDRRPRLALELGDTGAHPRQRVASSTGTHAEQESSERQLERFDTTIDGRR